MNRDRRWLRLAPWRVPLISGKERKKSQQRSKEGMVTRLEHAPVRSSITNCPREERVSGRKRRSKRMKHRPLDWTNRSVGTFHRGVLDNGGIRSQVAGVAKQSSGEKGRRAGAVIAAF